MIFQADVADLLETGSQLLSGLAFLPLARLVWASCPCYGSSSAQFPLSYQLPCAPPSWCHLYPSSSEASD